MALAQMGVHSKSRYTQEASRAGYEKIPCRSEPNNLDLCLSIIRMMAVIAAPIPLFLPLWTENPVPL